MNQLEEALMKSVVVAWNNYEYISGGWWLSHAPESFLQSQSASYISRNIDTNIFPECSPKRWKASLEDDSVKRGRSLIVNDKQRFDLIVWWKRNTPRAIVEIKRAYSANGVLSDADKVWRYRKEATKYGFGAAYLLVYTEACKNRGRGGGKKTVEQRFEKWNENIYKNVTKHVSLLGVTVKEPRGQLDHREDDHRIWSWGAALYKIDLRQ